MVGCRGVSIPLFSGLCFYIRNRLDVRSRRCLNPFVFRAVFLPTSQQARRLLAVVSIPLFSGLCFYLSKILSIMFSKSSLNPFVFRAVFLQPWNCPASRKRRVSIPLFSGLCFYRPSTRYCRCPRRLNSFVFRAVFLQQVIDSFKWPTKGLNPFVFRAVFLRKVFVIVGCPDGSQSLCFQGCVFTDQFVQCLEYYHVSIPLFSGLCFYRQS